MHWQNLNDRNGKTGFPWHGRAWFGRFRVEWAIPAGVSLAFKRDSEGLLLALCFGVFGLYFGWERWKNVPDREIRLAIHGGAIWASLWANPNEWNRSDPWYRQSHSFHFVDFMLGRHKHTEETIETRDVLIPMPEGSYPATVRMVRAKWKRSRWFGVNRTCADVKIEKGIPVEGKGENSWDCGEDATYGLWMPNVTSVEDAIGKVVASCLKDRKKYGTPSRLVAVQAA
jgi:hypothetical protein